MEDILIVLIGVILVFAVLAATYQATGVPLSPPPSGPVVSTLRGEPIAAAAAARPAPTATPVRTSVVAPAPVAATAARVAVAPSAAGVAPVAAPAGARVYVVRRGDTLF